MEYNISKDGTLISVQFTNEERYHLNDIIIPAGVTSIKENVFSANNTNTTNIQSVVFPEGLIKIENCAFRGQTNLQKIIFPSTLKIIGGKAFESIGKASINISSNAKSLRIDPYAFSWSNITSVTIESQEIILNCGAFMGCELLETVDLSKSMKSQCLTGVSIPENCFELDHSLTEVHLPEVSYVGAYAFSETSIRGITIIGKTTFGAVKIKDSAFYNCQHLESVQLLSSDFTLDNNSFRQCCLLREINLEKTSYIGVCAFSNSFAPDAEISIVFKPGAVIKASAFSFSNIKEADLTSISELGNEVFKECLNLKKIILPQLENFKIIPTGCFSNTCGLDEVVWGNNITVIEPEAFAYTGLKNIIFPKNLKEIKYKAFYKSKLESVDFSKSTNLEYIDTFVFFDTNLSKVDLSQNFFFDRTLSYMAFDSNINVLYSYYS